jgi:extradiol dioxygenase family protein
MNMTVVDGDDVPVPHYGACLNSDQFHELKDRLISHNIKFIIEPHLRFQGQPGTYL